MELGDRLRVKPRELFDLARRDTDTTPGIDGNAAAKEALSRDLDRLSELQFRLFAESRRALLVVLQAMDAGGKDGTIRKVVTAFNPQGCRVVAFKVPTAEEAAHDFLWRVHKAVPARGEVAVFNRSHYEDVLVVRVHGLVPKAVWSRRYSEINAFEKLLAGAGVTIVKFFLHVSKEEQKERFQERLDDPDRHWKLGERDFEERKLWADYMRAYEEALRRCSTPQAPWYVIPADKKWYRNFAVARILVETLEALDLRFPEPTIDVSKLVLE